MESRVLGILGGGQLGRMTVEAANRLNIETRILDADEAPAKQINSSPNHVTGSFNDPEKIKELADRVDVLTIEIEHVNADALSAVNKPVIPSPETIRTIQDKFVQKQHLSEHKIATATSEAVKPTQDSLRTFGNKYGYPFMLKSRKDAYDGRGNAVVESPEWIELAINILKGKDLYAEQWASFSKELAVMVIKSGDRVVSYPTVETVHRRGVLNTVFVPARDISTELQERAQKLARSAIASFSDSGVFGVEMFLLQDDRLLINEIAPRPHNSGHYTQDACITSQFEAHVRACFGLPLPDGCTNLTTPTTSAIMLNVLGAQQHNEELHMCERALATPGAAVHLYGKSSRPGRKVGHINIVGDNMTELERKLAWIERGEPYETEPAPLVGVIMGSDSDLPVMKAACKILEDMAVRFEVAIVSAHRTPRKMVEYAEKAEERGLKVIIAGAGGAAHLPGMVAASTVLPVIGVPVKGSTLDGVDSLHSIVQMPRGVPVATVAINNATNAGLLAVRMLGAAMPSLRSKLAVYAANSRKEVEAKDKKLHEMGYSSYAWP